MIINVVVVIIIIMKGVCLCSLFFSFLLPVELSCLPNLNIMPQQAITWLLFFHALTDKKLFVVDWAQN